MQHLATLIQMNETRGMDPKTKHENHKNSEGLNLMN